MKGSKRNGVYTTDIPWGSVTIPLMKWITVCFIVGISIRAINTIGKLDENIGALIVAILIGSAAVWGLRRARGDHLEKAGAPKGTHDTLSGNADDNKAFNKIIKSLRDEV